MIAVEIRVGRDITRFGAVVVSVRGDAGARRGIGERRFGAPDFVIVSFGGGPALAIGTGAESGPMMAKFAIVSVCPGSTGLSNVTWRVSESIAATS